MCSRPLSVLDLFPLGQHRRAASSAVWVMFGAPRSLPVRASMGSERIHYHFYHFGAQLPLESARKRDSLRVSANAVVVLQIRL